MKYERNLIRLLYGVTTCSSLVSILMAVSLVALSGTPVEARPCCYVANNGERPTGSVSVIDTATNGVIATVPVDGHPWAVAIAPGRRRAYVTSSSVPSVFVFDTESHGLIATITNWQNLGFNPVLSGGIAITPDGTRAYVADNGCAAIPCEGTIRVIDTATNGELAPIRNVGFRVGGVGRYPGRDQALCNTIKPQHRHSN